MIDKFLRNPQTNTLAVIVLIALIISWIVSIILISRDKPVSSGKNWYTRMLFVITLTAIPAALDLLRTSGAALVFALIAFLVLVLNIVILILLITKKTTPSIVKDWFKWSIPVLVIGGLVVSGYFIFIEVTGGPLMCGPSQGCIEVQNSRYATLFEIISMGEFGFAGYIGILAGWLVWQYGPASLKKSGALVIWVFCIFGVLFSAYLTFLEPFVIGATCMWCILSAVFMMMLLLTSTPAAQQAFSITDE